MKWLAPRSGQIIVLVLLAPMAVSLLQLTRSNPTASAVPLLYLAGTALFGLVGLATRRTVSLDIPPAALGMCAGILAFGALIWFGIPYAVASTLLLAVGFLAIGRRSIRVTAVTWIGAQALAYGFFGLVLGVPLH